MKGAYLIFMFFFVFSCKDDAVPVKETPVVSNSLVLRRGIGDKNHPISKLTFEDDLIRYELEIRQNFFGYNVDPIDSTSANYGAVGFSVLGRGDLCKDSVLRKLRPFLSCFTRDCNQTAFEYTVLLNDTVFRIDRQLNKAGVDFCAALFSKFSKIEKGVEMRFDKGYKMDSSFYLFDSNFDSLSRIFDQIDKKS